MKKLYLVIGLVLIVPIHAYAVELYLGNQGSNLNAVMHTAGSSEYYKCSNSVAFSCQSDAVFITYTSKVSGSGTSASPYIISGCSFVSCACPDKYYLSGTTCVKCSDNALAAETAGLYHTNKSCQYCPSNMLKKIPAQNVIECIDCPVTTTGACDGSETVKCVKGFYGTTSCSQCPPAQYQSCMGSFGTTDGPGAKEITECYIDTNGRFCDETGNGVFTDKCSYTK